MLCGGPGESGAPGGSGDPGTDHYTKTNSNKAEHVVSMVYLVCLQVLEKLLGLMFSRSCG